MKVIGTVKRNWLLLVAVAAVVVAAFVAYGPHASAAGDGTFHVYSQWVNGMWCRFLISPSGVWSLLWCI